MTRCRYASPSHAMVTVRSICTATAAPRTAPTRPPTVMRQARAAAGLDVIALTDHDTVAGHAEALPALPPGLTLRAGHGAVLPAATATACTCWPTCSTRPTPSWPAQCAAIRDRPGAPRRGHGRPAGRARRRRHLGAGHRDRRRRGGRPPAHRQGAGRGRGVIDEPVDGVHPGLDRAGRPGLRGPVRAGPGPGHRADPGRRRGGGAGPPARRGRGWLDVPTR